MLKRILIISSILCLGGIIVLSFFFFKKQQVKHDFQIVNAVPINSFCILEINNMPQFINNTLSNNPIWQNLTSIPAINTLQSDIKYLNSLFASDIRNMNYLNGKTMLISMHYTGNMDFDYLFTIGLENESNADNFIETVSKKMETQGTLTTYTYDNIPVYNVKFGENSQIKELYFSIINNMFIVSKARVLVQSSIGQVLANESLLKNESFAYVNNSSDKEKSMNIFINYKTIPKFLSYFISKKYYKTVLQSNKLANWAELDISLKNNELIFNGFITTDSLSDNFLHMFSDQEPVSMNIQEVIPANASIILAIGVSDPQKYKQTYEDCLRKDGSYKNYKKGLNELDSLCDQSIENLFYDFMENEMCLVLTGNTAENIQENSYAVFNTKSKRLAEEKLIGMLDSYSRKNRINMQTLKSTIRIDNEISFDIYRMPSAGIPKQLFGGFFSWTEANYFTFIDNYLVMGNTISSLNEYIKSILLNKTLKTDTKFTEFTERLPDQYNFLIYSKVASSMQFYKDLLDEPYQKQLDENYDTYSKFQSFAYQLSSSKGKLYNTIYVTYNSLNESKSQALWDSNLDTNVYSNPAFVYNCLTKDKDIFVQDIRNTVYLINKTGRVLWKKQINEKIASEIFEVDCFKNGKIQYAFSTNNYIYIIDRLGNFVTNYPLQLSAPASAGMSVFDFDNNKTYQMIIPCRNKNVYSYNIEGKLMKDWHFEKSDAPITQPIQAFRIRNTDYILCADNYSTYILNRKGEKKIAVNQKFEITRNSKFYVDKSNINNAENFYITDKEGHIKKISLNGSVSTITIDDFSTDHYFACADLNYDGNNEFIFVDNETFRVYGSTGNKLFAYNFDSDITDPIRIYSMGSRDTRIGILCRAENKIYLFNANGSISKGFPIQGSTMFSISKFSQNNTAFNLIVGNNNSLLSNYEIK